MALNYYEKPIAKWNVKNLIDYMSDKHRERFGVDYAPFGSWAAERGRISQAFGTTKKPGKYDKELIVRFVDHCMETYKPSAQYPGINFGFMLTYRLGDLQTLEKAYNEEKRLLAETSAEQNVDEDVAAWFGS